MLDGLFSALRRLLRLLGLTRAAPVAVPVPAPAAAAPHGRDLGRPVPPPATLNIPQLVATAGAFPARGGSGPAIFVQGLLHGFAGGAPIFGAPRASGEMIQVSANPSLYSVLGPSFGGDGIHSFALPSLVSRAAVGGGSVGQPGPGTLALTLLIATDAGSGPPLATVMPFGGNYAPDGWAIADGSIVPIRENIPLFEAIGTAFGGDGTVTFALPKLDPGEAPGTTPTGMLGVGAVPGLPPVARGQRLPGAIGGQADGLGLNFLICTAGPVPTTGGAGAFPDAPYLGQVIGFAGAAPPPGWALCDGSLVPVASNGPLFALIGTTYGGDGKASFALPDLRGKAMTGI